MSVTLVTAAPGTGKTAYVVGELMLKAFEQNRPIYTMGIPELLVPHCPVPSVLDDWTELRESEEVAGLMLPYFTFPPNSLIFIDEAQRVYRVRPNGSKVPDFIAAFETHRHTGVDFVLMTQHPTYLDAHVRKAVSRHVHLRDAGFLGRWFYEWPEATDVAQFKNAPVKAKYKLPKRAFGLYKSSSLHTKLIRKVPPVLYLAAFAVIGLGFFGFKAWGIVNSKMNGKPSELAQAQTMSISAKLPPDAIASSVTPQSMILEMAPRVFDRPETAPVYDGLRVAKDMPQIVGCIKYEDDCSCRTQQGSRAQVSVQYCRDWMKGNRPFNPYLPPPQAPQPSEPQEVVQEKPLGATYAVSGTPPWPLKIPSSTVDKQPQQPAPSPI